MAAPQDDEDIDKGMTKDESKELDEAIKYVENLRKLQTGEVFLSKMRGYTYSFFSNVGALEQGGLWTFWVKLVSSWWEVIVKVSGREASAELESQKKATEEAYEYITDRKPLKSLRRPPRRRTSTSLTVSL
jgi:hypothetical protein